MYYYGDFYNLNDCPCRSTLEIVKCMVEQPNELLCKRPDIVVVMMNPGGSSPKSNDDGGQRTPAEIGRCPQLAPTCPDKAQEAVVKLMRCMRYKHARVLNLSDIRKAKGFPNLAGGSLPAGHSIFCDERRDELRARLCRQTVVVAGWSYHKELGQLGRVAYDILRSLKLEVLGWEPRFGFAYPHLTKGKDAERKRDEWLNGIAAMLLGGYPTEPDDAAC